MARRGRKPTTDLSRVSCPNPECPDYQKTGNPAIVANGTYPTRSGLGQRFKCKTCGQFFCRRTGTIFEGLHTSEEKVISSLKLLAKGMTVRRAAEVLCLKPDTLRRWLSILALQSETVNLRLSQELGVSEAELSALWNYVNQDALKKRAILWRKKCGWRKSWGTES